MKSRVRAFAFQFSSEFEKILQREIAKTDVLGKCRMPGVLVARGMVGPVLVAFYKAFRAARISRPGPLLTTRENIESAAKGYVPSLYL